MFEKYAQLEKSTCDHVINHLDSLSDNLNPDISNYARGRQRFWVQTEYPLSLKYQQFRTGVRDKRLWDWVNEVWHKSGLGGEPESALAIYGGVPIEFHPDAPCAAPNAVQINLGGTVFIHDSAPAGQQNRNGRIYTPTSPVEHTLDRGEITRFNCKHVHATVDPQPDRWSMIVWQISQHGRSAYQEFAAKQ